VFVFSKAAVHHLTKKLASDLASSNITVNAIAPGFVPSKMSQQLVTYATQETIKKNIPMGRYVLNSLRNLQTYCNHCSESQVGRPVGHGWCCLVLVIASLCVGYWYASA
jgi:NAD(P)-dependent dehydrogenase (short-subunit alcohol dehydrogenase family)